jgi:3-oxoacyl-[acyl-carrier protein] reductase
MNENVLIFGGNSFLAKAFCKKYSKQFAIKKVFRNSGNDSDFDFETDDAEAFAKGLTEKYHAILFFQGINPSIGAKQMTSSHFVKMLQVNLITPALLVKNLATLLHKEALILFVSSISKKKGSYDPAYASAKAGLTGLMHSLANAWPDFRFNIISLGLVEGSPIYESMTPDFRIKHSKRMFSDRLIRVNDVANVVKELINNHSINRTDVEIDGGYH